MLEASARELYRIPDGVRPLTGLGIGHVADTAALPEDLRVRDLVPRMRRPMAEFVFGDRQETASDFGSRAGVSLCGHRGRVIMRCR
jgi:hypothetical protein